MRAEPNRPDLSPAENGSAELWTRLRCLLTILGQLALVYLIVRAFKLESVAFSRLFLLSMAGFAINSLLPLRWRWAFFALFSVGCVVGLLGLETGAWLILLGFVLIGSAHLPLRFAWRVLLILLLGGLLAWLRTGRVESPWSAAIWPLFGSMFMFRLIVYLYDLRNRSAPFSLARAVGYFFMAPNVCFPLFPVVDYKTFCRSHFDDAPARIYQTGVEWICKGVVQLLAYGIVYQYLAIDASVVFTAVDALRFLASGYALYLKISGSFHLVVGLLHLFGFNLPLTNQNYFLAAGFTDYWRRINVYWKDFLQKIFFNPLYFRFHRRMAPSVALTAATIIAFLVTWALHSYQWFWIRGAFPIRAQDIVFWTAMGLLVLANVHYEYRFGRKRDLKRREHLRRADLLRGLRAAATFAVISVLWGIWSTESLGEFGLVMSRLARFDWQAAAWLAGGVGAIVLCSLLLIPREQAAAPARPRLGAVAAATAQDRTIQMPSPASVGRVVGACMLILLARYLPRFVEVPAQWSSVIERLHGSQLSRWDAEKLDRGYYEDLTGVVNFNTELSDLYAQRPINWNRNEAQRPQAGFPPLELIPSASVEFKGARFSTNRWQMRDRDYDRLKPTGTLRLAILGESNTLGQGVHDGETFENLVEDRLNAERPEGSPRYELLNFAMADCGPIAKLATLERVLEFQPDAVLYMSVNELFWIVKELVLAVQDGRELPAPELRAAVERLALTPRTPRAEAVQTLESSREEILGWLYGDFVRRCHERGVPAWYAVLPLPRDLPQDQRFTVERETELAMLAGFERIDISQALAGVEYRELWLKEWDQHVNARGQALIARALLPVLRDRFAQLGDDGSRR